MNRLFTSPRRSLISPALLMILLFVSIPALFAQDSPTTGIDTFINNQVDSDLFSGTFLIARGDEILLDKGYGLADREWNIPNIPESKFRIGSITKQFTAVAILMLQERGELTVQDPICDYLEDCAETWGDITIHQLLTHTSGIHSMTDMPDFAEWMTLPATPKTLVEYFMDEPLDFEPGTDWYYSNSGYILLGLIIEAASGQSYRRFLTENIFEPLRMENTGYDVNTSVLTNRARGYASPTRNADYINMSVPYSAGALYSTTGDLYKWTRALFDGQVISQETLEASLGARVEVPDQSLPGQYSYGLMLLDIEGHRMIGHGGNINGFAAWQSYFPDEDVTIIVLSNLESADTAGIAFTSLGMLYEE
jgi:CubicO group peptidase (beta-lactamase class C family)